MQNGAALVEEVVPAGSGVSPSPVPKGRPSVPEFEFGARKPEVGQPVIEPGSTVCSNCKGVNKEGTRFCITCGLSLEAQLKEAAAAQERARSQSMATPVATPIVTALKPPTPIALAPAAPVPIASTPIVPSPAPPVVSPLPAAVAPIAAIAHAAPIAPTPMVPIGGARPAPATVRVCLRCRGACDSGTAFCKFCGASLADAPVTAAAPAAPPVPKPTAAAPPPVSSGPIASPPTPTSSGPVSKPVISSPVASPGIGPAALPVPIAPVPVAPPPAPPAAPPAPPAPQVSTASKPAALPLPQGNARGKLVIIAKDGGEGQSYPIHATLDIGRSEGDVVIADDRYLSPRHARLIWKDKQLILRDMGSANGVYLRIPSSGGDAPPRPTSTPVAQKLSDQDLILIGQQVIRFEIVKDAEEGLGAAMQHGTLLFGTPTAPRYARLCQRTVEGVTRDVFHVRKAETVLGRESGDIVFTEDPFLSRRHAVIRYDAARKTFTIADFGSSNGTFLQIHGDVTVKSGDEFRVGQQLFRILIGEA
jgi:pSer/pThr/pTyr-binding forkhead associated (FHA) protein